MRPESLRRKLVLAFGPACRMAVWLFEVRIYDDGMTCPPSPVIALPEVWHGPLWLSKRGSICQNSCWTTGLTPNRRCKHSCVTALWVRMVPYRASKPLFKKCPFEVLCTVHQPSSEIFAKFDDARSSGRSAVPRSP